MKKIFSAFFLVAMSGCATVRDDLPPLAVTSTHMAPGKTSKELCGSARDWAALTFRDSKEVVQVYDPDRGRMIGRGNFTAYGFAGTPFVVGFAFIFDCKDGSLSAKYSQYTVSSSGLPTSELREDSMNNLRTKSEAMTRRLDTGLAGMLGAQ